MYLLDSDFLSQTEKKQPNPAVMDWLSKVNPDDTFISVITLTEIQTGLALMPTGRRRLKLEHWLEIIVADFAQRTIAVDPAIARECGRLLADAKLRGYTASLSDALVAASAKVHGLQVATLNRKHYLQLGIELVKF